MEKLSGGLIGIFLICINVIFANSQLISKKSVIDLTKWNWETDGIIFNLKKEEGTGIKTIPDLEHKLY